MKKRYQNGLEPMPKILNFPISEWLATRELSTLSHAIQAWVSLVLKEGRGRVVEGEFI
jgi:hypothetical protein